MKDSTVKKNMVGRPINEARKAMEESLGVNARQVQRIIRELGLERIRDMGELRLLEKRIVIALRSLQARRGEFELDLAKRTVLPVDEVVSLGIRIGNLTEAAFADLVVRAPGELAGEPELSIYHWLQRAAAECVNNLRREVMKLKA